MRQMQCFAEEKNKTFLKKSAVERKKDSESTAVISFCKCLQTLMFPDFFNRHSCSCFLKNKKIKKFQKGVDFFAGLSYNTKRATDEANKTKKKQNMRL